MCVPISHPKWQTPEIKLGKLKKKCLNVCLCLFVDDSVCASELCTLM